MSITQSLRVNNLLARQDGVSCQGKLEAQPYTVTEIQPLHKGTVLPALRRARLQGQLIDNLMQGQLAARVVYSLLLLGLTSGNFSLDFYALCYVCKVQRSRRSSLRKILTRSEKLRILRRPLRCRIETSTAGPGEPPVVMRELRPGDLKKKGKRQPAYDLALLFMNQTAQIPERWGKILGRRPRSREGYQFDREKIEPTLAVLLPMTGLLLKPEKVAAWAGPQISMVHEKLQELMQRYQISEEHQDRLRRLLAGTQKAKNGHALAFAGFALLHLAT